MRRFARGIITFATALLIAGCAWQSSPEPGDIVRGGPFPVIERRAYRADAPSALLTLSNSGAAGRGTIRGIIHGWPFAHADPGGDFGEGLFTYRINFIVTARAADGARMPLRARGERTVYFHPDREPISIEQTDAFSAGEPVITDTVELAFAFDSNATTVQVTTIMRQTGARAFVWNEQSLTPPDVGVRTAAASGSYSARLGGYVFASSL
jgi:hypothetical protein